MMGGYLLLLLVALKVSAIVLVDIFRVKRLDCFEDGDVWVIEWLWTILD